MKILLVEDDDFKRSVVEAALKTRMVPDVDSLVNVDSVRAAVGILVGDQFDWIILDMALPSHTALRGSGQSMSLLGGGLEILGEISYNHRAEKVVVLTQYPEVEVEGILLSHRIACDKLRNVYGENLMDIVLYQHGSDKWLNFVASLVWGN